MASSKFFGRIASFFDRKRGGEPEPQPASKSKTATETPKATSEAFTGRSTERALGSMSASGGSHTFAPTRPQRGAATSPHRSGRDEPRRVDYEGEDAPKGLWSDPRHERLSDPFADRPSREYPRHSQSIH